VRLAEGDRHAGVELGRLDVPAFPVGRDPLTDPDVARDLRLQTLHNQFGEHRMIAMGVILRQVADHLLLHPDRDRPGVESVVRLRDEVRHGVQVCATSRDGIGEQGSDRPLVRRLPHDLLTTPQRITPETERNRFHTAP